MSLAQMMHFSQDVFQMTAMHLNLSTEVVNHSDVLFFQYGMNLLIDGHFEFSIGLWINLIYVILQEPPEINIWEWVGQIGLMWRSLGFTAPADQLMRESMVEPLHQDVGCMWSYLTLLEPLHISIHTMKCSKCPSELFLHISVMLFCDSDCLLICVFKPKWFNYYMLWDGHLGHAFHRGQKSLKHRIWGFCAPVNTVITIDMSQGARNVFSHWTKHHQRSQNPFHSYSWTLGTSLNIFHVSWCQFTVDLDSVWVRLKIILEDSLQ